MKKKTLFFFAILTFFVWPAFSIEAPITSRTATLEIIDVQELAKIQDQVSVIDARQSEFEKGHIPNSQNMDWKNWSEEKPGLKNAVFGDQAKWGRILTDNSVQNRLRQLGLSHNTLIVVVGSGRESWGEEGRIAWNLLFWGAQRVALLDGGYPRWAQMKLPVQKGKAKPAKPGDFIYSLNLLRRASKADVFDNLKNSQRLLLDVRSLKEYDGQKMPGQKRGGHIPKSKLVEFNGLYQEDGRYINATQLKKLVGSEISEKPITYCTGGVRSALLALLLEARLGIFAANYDASMWEWSSDEKLPVEKKLK